VAAALIGMWLLLNETVAPGAVLLGAALAIAAAMTLRTLDLPGIGLRRLHVALRLALHVLVEIVRSNYAVARIIVRPQARRGASGFVRIPLDTRNPYSLTLLACIITATPGTLWADYDSAENAMVLHVLDLIDEQQWITTVKESYEKPLMEIFG
jgi:multicomponent K+:H+ antiporter subunit E